MPKLSFRYRFINSYTFHNNVTYVVMCRLTFKHHTHSTFCTTASALTISWSYSQ